MQKTITYSIFVILLMFSCGADSSTTSQVEWQAIYSHEVADTVQITGYDFVDMTADTIIDSLQTMHSFYQKLQKASTTPDDSAAIQVSIIHYGDSHIQAGVLTDVVMRRLQNRFGNAGRGMVVPHKLSRTNEPRDYRITSPTPWISSRMTEPRPQLSAGMTGMAIRSDRPNELFTINTLRLPEDSINRYTFNRVVVFHDSLAPMVTVAEDLLADISPSDTDYGFTSEIDLTFETDSLELYTYRQAPFNQGSYFGFSLENGRSGVLYHALGVNSSCYLHWGRNPTVAVQSRALKPDLMTISLGSNEAAGGNFNDQVFYREIDSFVTKLRISNPGVPILLITPAEAMKKTRRVARPNPNFRRVQRVILQYAEDKDLAVFDLYNATSGEGSSKEWDRYKLLQRDKIHYTAEGYAIQGLLQYGAILNGYLKFQSENNLEKPLDN